MTRPRLTVAEALRLNAQAAALGHPGAERRRNDLLAYAAGRGARIRTLAAITGHHIETVHRWVGGTSLRREQILNDPCPDDLIPDLPAPPAPGQETFTMLDSLPL